MTLPQRNRITLAAIARIEASELEHEVIRDYNVLVTTVIAEATGTPLHHSARAWLNSHERLQDWLDALLCADGELHVAHERMAHFGDQRAKDTLIRLSRIRKRQADVRVLLKASKAEQHRSSPDNVRARDAVHLSRRWLGDHFKIEVCARRDAITQKQGISRHSPAYSESPISDWAEYIEQAHEIGVLRAPITPAVQRLMNLDDNAFRHVVAEDCKEQNERNISLRHPLLLSDGYNALLDLTDRLAPLALASSVEQLGPIRDALKGLDEEDAMRILKTRRFFAAVLQRKMEWRCLKRRIMVDITERHREVFAPWREAFEEAHTELVHEHPAKYTFVRETIRRNLQDADSGRRLSDRVISADCGKVRKHILDALEDGTWLSANKT